MVVYYDLLAFLRLEAMAIVLVEATTTAIAIANRESMAGSFLS